LGALGLLLVVVWVTAGSTVAQPLVRLDSASDGQLVIIGDGWRPGQKLVVSLGRDVFPAFADSAGEFEVLTGLSGSTSLPLSIRHLESALPAMAELTETAPNPLAVAFAEDVLAAATAVALAFAGLGAIVLARRSR
jgi:hypothetical protein